MTSRIKSPDTPADTELRLCVNQTPPQSFIMKAGAGSGKTTSLVKGLQHISDRHGPALRQAGQKVACITYTKVAVAEIWSDVGNAPLFHVSTIHSFLWSVIRPFQSDIRTWVLSRIDEKIAKRQEHHDKRGTRANTKERLQREMEELRAERLAMQGVERFEYSTASDYANGVLGHDDILKMVPDCVHQYPLLRRLVAAQYPFIFVDESQDTDPIIVEALRQVAITQEQSCIGFFGDPMQKIYPTGAGDIPCEETWEEITKPENFRCPTSVLSVINAIRAPGDGLVQTRGRMIEVNGELEPVEGSVHLFILPADGQRTARMEAVRRWLSRETEDPLWLTDTMEGDVRLLVLVHRMAAIRLGFPSLYAALHDDAPSNLSEGLQDGTAWPLRPFLQSIIPLVLAARRNDQFGIIAQLRSASPLMKPERLEGQDLAELLARLSIAVARLVQMFEPGAGTTLLQVLTHVRDTGLVQLDDRFGGFLVPNPDELIRTDFASVTAFLRCNASELWGYKRYIEDESPFATQQGVKGAQFERVLVVLDDEEGRHTHFSYGKYLGFVEPSDRDQERLDAGEESVLDRTRRLFYVCCSRAAKDLAVVLFAPDVVEARAAIVAGGLFPEDAILGVDAL